MPGERFDLLSERLGWVLSGLLWEVLPAEPSHVVQCWHHPGQHGFLIRQPRRNSHLNNEASLFPPDHPRPYARTVRAARRSRTHAGAPREEPEIDGVVIV